MRGKPCLGAAEMPLTPSTGCVASRGQQLRDRDLPQRQPVRNATKRDLVCARADGKAARHERRPTGRALSFDIEVEQPHAFACEVVDTRRGRTAKDATAVNAQFAVAQVVHKHEDNIWLLFLRFCRSDSAKYRSRSQ